MTVTKVVENRLRRVARRQGLELHKSRARDPRDQTYGRYRLVSVTLGPSTWKTFAEVAAVLREPLEPGPPQKYATGFFSPGPSS